MWLWKMNHKMVFENWRFEDFLEMFFREYHILRPIENND